MSTSREEQIRWALKNAPNDEARSEVEHGFLKKGGEDAAIISRLHSFTADNRPRSTKRVGIAQIH